MKNKKSVNLMKRVGVCFIMALALCLYPGNSGLNGQSVASETSNSSCNAGGEMWVCGSSQLAQAHSDFNSNCSGWEYRCGQTLKTIKDVCAPEIVTSTITSKAC